MKLTQKEQELITILLNAEERQRRSYIAAIDEISYIGAQFAKRMGMTTEYDTAKNHMDNIICRVEGVLEDLELSRDDAEPEE